MKKYIFILLILFPFLLNAGDSTGTAGMQFLKLGSDARGNSMAGAMVGEVNDIDSIYWNPAGLSYLNSMMFTATYNKWIGDMNYFYLGYGTPLFSNKIGSLGLSVTFLDEGTLEDTFSNLGDINSLNSYDLAISGAYGLKLGAIRVGGVLRFIQKKILEETSTGGVIDIGGQLEMLKSKNLKIGMIVRNLGWASKTVEKPDNMPIMYQAGLSYNYPMGNNNLLGVISSDFSVDEAPVINVGLEYGFGRLIYLRGGYKYETSQNNLGGMKGLSFGAGGRIGVFLLDVNYLSFGELGQSIQSTFSVKFGGTDEKKEEDDDKLKDDTPIKSEVDEEKSISELKKLEKARWIKKEEALLLSKKLRYEDFEDENIISKFEADSGNFTIAKEDGIKYGKWEIKQDSDINVLKTSIRLPDLSKFDGVLLSVKSKNINNFKIILIEISGDIKNKWVVTIQDVSSEWRDIKIPFRYFYLEENPKARLELSNISQLQFKVEGLSKDGYIGIDNIKFYKE